MSIETLGQIHTPILAALAAALPGVTVTEYPAYQKSIALPGVVLELASWRRSYDPGTSQIGLNVRFEARAIVAPEAPGAQLAVRELALRIERIVHFQTWGLPIEAARPFGEAAEDGFKPELDGYLVWLVSWEHFINIGAAVDWETIGSASGPVYDLPEAFRPATAYPVRTVLVGMYPETGPGHEADYWPTNQPPPDNWGDHTP